MNNEPTKPFGTLELIHRLHDAESLTEDDAMELATYLNEREDARRTWPGNMLFDFFVNVYEDGNMRLYELESLALMIQAIVIHANGMTAEAAESEAPALDAAGVDSDTILLPPLEAFDEQGFNYLAGSPEMYFATMQCDCLDWQTVRRKLPPNSPGRLCKHLCRALYRHVEELPKNAGLLRHLVHCSGQSGRALAPQPGWCLAVPGNDPVIAAWGSGNTCEIYAPDENGAPGAFTYNLRERQWSFGRRPKNSHDPRLKAFLAERVAEFAERVNFGTSA